MSEDPIKLFATLSERIPQRSDRDVIRGAAEKALEQFPGVGPVVVWVASEFIGSSFERRREAWWKDFAVGFEKHVSEEPERLLEAFQSEEFITAVAQASRIAIATHENDKRKALRNALVNIVDGLFPEEDLQHVYFRLIDQFTTSHIRLLRYFWLGNAEWYKIHNGQPPTFATSMAVLETLQPEFRGRADFVNQMIKEMNAAGVTQFGSIMDTHPGPNLPNFGTAFLRFILRPEDFE